MLAIDDFEPLDIDTDFCLPPTQQLIRIGVIPDGSCFFHCVMLARKGAEYIRMSIGERQNYVKKLRRKIADKLTPEIWKMHNPDIAHIQLQSEIRNLIKRMTSIPIADFDTVILPRVFNQINGHGHDHGPDTRQYASLLTQVIVDQYFKDGTAACKRGIKQFIKDLIHHAEEKAFCKYARALQEEYVDVYMLDLLSMYLQCNICVLDGKTDRPYRGLSCATNFETSVILRWVDDVHYELVCLHDLSANDLQSEFHPSDPLILKLFKASREK